MSQLLHSTPDNKVAIFSFYSGQMKKKCYQVNYGGQWFHFDKEEDALRAYELFSQTHNFVKTKMFYHGEG
jgi:hypothetical protein